MINHSIQSVVKIHEGFVKENIMKQEEFDKYYILKDNFLTDFIISDENKNLRQKFVHSCDISSEELKKGIFFLSFGYLDLNDDEIRIYIGKRKLKLEKEAKKKIFSDVSVNGYKFTYKYSCDKQKWELIDSPR